MVRTKTQWVCQECGFQASGFLGRCTECGAWGSLVEELGEVKSLAGPKGRATIAGAANALSAPILLEDVDQSAQSRILTGIAGLDEVLGGGLVPGAVILLAGDPGVGKSTLLLQVAKKLAANHKILYISGEESAPQISLRASRLGMGQAKILVKSESNVASIFEYMAEADIRIVVVDSIQSIYHPEISSAPGSVSQVRECAQVICAQAKSRNITSIIVGHVNKEGAIAGPRVLEHMVDVVLQFEGERKQGVRILRSGKNRYGSTSEIAVFSMNEEGLSEVENPSAFFLGQRLDNLARRAPSGTCVIAGGDGNRPMLLEVQALVGLTTYPNPRRVANGWDYNRLLQAIAVLEKKIGLSLSSFDIYINVVGGLDFNDPAGDLGISIAITSSYLDRSIDPGLLVIGEVGLTGEVRAVPSCARKLKEAARLGFTKALVPKANLPISGNYDSLKIIGVESLSEAIAEVMPQVKIPGKKEAQVLQNN